MDTLPWHCNAVFLYGLIFVIYLLAFITNFQERYTVTRLCLHPTLSQFVAQTHAGYAAVFSTQRPYKMNKNKRFEGHKVGSPLPQYIYHVQRLRECVRTDLAEMFSFIMF